jgi:hypothetical protein
MNNTCRKQPINGRNYKWFFSLYLTRMKYLASIFCIYCILLAILPCQDGDAQLNSPVLTTIQQIQAAPHTDKHDLCPPFCTCTCCSNARQLGSRPMPYIYTKAVASTYPGYAIHATRKQTIAIWQPPQMS